MSVKMLSLPVFALATLIALATPIDAQKPPTKLVNLEIHSEPLPLGGRFDIAKDFRTKLSQAGILVVGLQSTVEADAIVRIDYRETQGTLLRGSRQASGHGVNTSLGVRVTNKEGAELLTLSRRSFQQSFSFLVKRNEPVTNDDISRVAAGKARDDLAASPEYAYSGHFVGAALSISASLRTLLKVVHILGVKGKIVELLNRTPFVPTNAVEESTIAIARMDYAQFTKFDRHAVEPLIIVLNDSGHIDALANGALAVFSQVNELFRNIVTRLKIIGDSTASNALTRFLTHMYIVRGIPTKFRSTIPTDLRDDELSLDALRWRKNSELVLMTIDVLAEFADKRSLQILDCLAGEQNACPGYVAASFGQSPAIVVAAKETATRIRRQRP